MKKVVSLVLVVCMVVSMMTIVSGCKSSSSGKGSINIYVWTEYVPDSVITKFTKETGIKVNVSTFSTNEELYSKMKSESSDGYDIVQPSDYMVEKLIAQNMLAKLDIDKITNYKNVGDSFKNPSYDPDNAHSMPYLGGLGAIAVNTAKIKTPVTSYADLFKSDFKDSLVVLDDERALIGMVAKSLGYSLNPTSKEELDKVAEKIMQLKSNIKLYDSDSPKTSLISGECTAGFIWSAEVAMAMQENPDIKIIFPSEGAFKFQDNWCIPAGSKNKELAEQFINYMMQGDTMVSVLNEFPYVNPNTAAAELLGSEYLNNPAKNIPADAIKKGEFVKNLDTSVQARYDEIWTNLKK